MRKIVRRLKNYNIEEWECHPVNYSQKIYLPSAEGGGERRREEYHQG
jgi:hypothetical protein